MFPLIDAPTVPETIAKL